MNRWIKWIIASAKIYNKFPELVERATENDAVQEFKDFFSNYQTDKEKYYNSKYPKKVIEYSGRHLIGKELSIDLRSFFVNSNSEHLKFEVLKGESDDKTAVAIQEWVGKNIEYARDSSHLGKSEFWLFPYETLKFKKGDCDDGAILMANMMVANGIPYWKVRINAGAVYNNQGDKLGYHAWTVYYSEKHDKWVAMDWCFYPDYRQIEERPEYEDDNIYTGPKSVWFSFNKRFAFSKGISDKVKSELNIKEKK